MSASHGRSEDALSPRGGPAQSAGGLTMSASHGRSEDALNCALCSADGGVLLWRGAGLRLVRAEEALYPAWWRLIADAHVAEFTDLDAAARTRCIDALALLEQALRETLQPDKINLASFGNVVPHLHWHVIARWRDDAHWPQPSWGAPLRGVDAARLDALRARLAQTEARAVELLAARFGA